MYEIDFDTLPRPEDDGAADHLPGMVLPDLPLASTDGAEISLGLQSGRVVVFCYPKTGQPGTEMPEGWDEIPGARGCTPQACAYRDAMEQLTEAGVDRVYGLSTQDTDWQVEAKERLHLPYPLLSDVRWHLTEALALPTFDAEGERLMKRLTMVIEDGTITHVHYPVFPPDKDVEWVLSKLG